MDEYAVDEAHEADMRELRREQLAEDICDCGCEDEADFEFEGEDEQEGGYDG